MNTNETITKLNAAMRRFDESAKPFGLYAIREARGLAKLDPENWGEWKFVLKPTLADLGFISTKAHFPSGSFEFRAADGHRLFVRLVRVSKIKVRKYGEAYRLDPHYEYPMRWKYAGLTTHLRSFAEDRLRAERLLVFLGFADEARPFEAEFAELAKGSRARMPMAKAESATEIWMDPHGRGFRTLCASWAWGAKVETSLPK
jgi:hypothetical protein